MARRRFSRRARSRPVFAKRARRSSRRSGGGSSVMKIVAAGAYGAVRERISNYIAPIASKVPLGTVADEAVLLTGAYFINKKVSNPFIKDVATAAMLIESARIGEAVANGTALSGASTSAPQYKVYG